MTTTSTPIAFIGTGAIGTPMALQLLQAGHQLTAVDPYPSVSLLERDVVAVASFDLISKERRPEIVIVMVATPQQLHDVVEVALAGDLSGQRWVIMSTVGPEAVRIEGQRLQAAGVHVLDAPVTGGVARAKTGELTIFASGVDVDLKAVQDVLECFGTVREVGAEIGQGQAIKVVNQHLASVHIVAAAEALALAGRLGLDPAEVLPLIDSGAAGSFMLSDRGPRMLQGTDVEVTSTIGIFVKDAGLVAQAAEAAGADTPLLDVARARYVSAAEAGLDRRDDSRVIETYTAGN
ncbi:NAD(P)-dependent oxidoreductase [Kineococcus rhizosphaerae]|uniref:3-hydroxyisobutyrate dehydrogenase/putative dehydrogenase n=1 Tax=Kineococcus rhizosphaerae TaxID=559628 RepID=A0A2T0QS98_9ACTN|nr:NAD(P)-dependent oxidoreductase [Kineococcus rhizosphaerae]PRY07797.1 3-hydroxyisobutyrate dehydrogenase/putative dehydrogenase [Kineococcus rhizosphaerae]